MNNHQTRRRRIAQIIRKGTDLAAETFRSGIAWDELVEIRDQLAVLDEERRSLTDPHYLAEERPTTLGG